MKKILLLTAIISLALASCQSEDSIEQNQSEIQLTSVINPMSRATSLTQQSTQIASGQEVGVIINGAKEAHTNVKWTVGEDGALTNTSTPIYWSNTEATIYAYHPYNSSWSGTDKLESFSVNTDQSTDAGYLNSDLLWATKTGTKTSNPVELSFVHKLSKINVTLTSTDIADLSGATISICGTKTSTSFNPITGELSAASNIANIKAGVTTTEAYTASAIIIPQTVANGTQLIKVTHNNKNFYYKLSTDKEFKAGHSYSYTLKVKEKLVEVEVESDNITDWTDEDINGDADEVDLSWFSPNQYISYVSNYEMIQTNDDASKPDLEIYRSYIKCPSYSSISKVEIKFQMIDNDYFGTESKPLRAWYGGGISLYDNQMSVSGNTYLWDDLGVEISDLIVLNISYKDKYIKLNGLDLKHNITSDENTISTSGYFFSGGYSSDYDDGWLREWKAGVSEGSKLYYVKFWNENDELVYLGAASKAINPTTNNEEYCWRTYSNGVIGYQFAHNSETLSNYQPYGGGTDE